MSERRITGFESWSYQTEEEGQAIRELESLSDRAAGIVAATLLENNIESILKIRLIDDASLMKDLFSDFGQLGSLSAKIEMAYALGLITKMGRTDLDIIRKIRNIFAHDLAQSTFESNIIKDKCMKLKLVDKLVTFPILPADIGPPPDTKDMEAFYKYMKQVDPYLPIPNLSERNESNLINASLMFPGGNAAILEDARSRFFLTINCFRGAMLMRPAPGSEHKLKPFF